MLSHQYPWIMARWDKDLPHMWLSQTPSWSSSRSDSDASRCTQSKYGPEKERLYNFLSSDIQNQGTFLCTFSAFDFSLGNTSLSRNIDIGSIQFGPNLIWWIWGKSLSVGVEEHKSSTSITHGKSCVEEVARVAKESTWVFPFLGIYDKSKNSNFVCIRLAWLKYFCILVSHASNSPFTWPTTSLESENISTVFPPIFWTIAILINRASYSASLFVAKKPNLKDFSMVILLGDIKTSPTTDPYWFATPSIYTFQGEGACADIRPTDFPSMPCCFTPISSGHSANLATKSARTYPFTEVRGIYLISKAPRIVPYLAILPV